MNEVSKHTKTIYGLRKAYLTPFARTKINFRKLPKMLLSWRNRIRGKAKKPNVTVNGTSRCVKKKKETKQILLLLC
jgi:hypothetical protein